MNNRGNAHWGKWDPQVYEEYADATGYLQGHAYGNPCLDADVEKEAKIKHELHPCICRNTKRKVIAVKIR